METPAPKQDTLLNILRIEKETFWTQHSCLPSEDIQQLWSARAEQLTSVLGPSAPTNCLDLGNPAPYPRRRAVHDGHALPAMVRRRSVRLSFAQPHLLIDANTRRRIIEPPKTSIMKKASYGMPPLLCPGSGRATLGPALNPSLPMVSLSHHSQSTHFKPTTTNLSATTPSKCGVQLQVELHSRESQKLQRLTQQSTAASCQTPLTYIYCLRPLHVRCNIHDDYRYLLFKNLPSPTRLHMFSHLPHR